MQGEHPVILFRTGFFGKPVPLDELNPAERAHFTSEASQLRQVDAVVFHIPDWRPSQLLDTPKYPGQKWVAWSMESAVNYPRLADPGFMRHFDYRMTYEQDADIWSPYLPLPEHWPAAQSVLPTKDEPVPLVMFQSALIDGCGRNAFSSALMRQIEVDSYGRVMRNRQLVGPDRGRQSKLATIARYRFCLSLENSIAADYVTEKLFDPLLVGTIPVYRGAPNAAEYAPEHSFIDAEAHGGPQGLAAYLRHLIATPAEYEAYFAWRQRPLPHWLEQKLAISRRHYLLRLLERVAAETSRPAGGRPTLPFGWRAAFKVRTRRALRGVASALGGRRAR